MKVNKNQKKIIFLFCMILIVFLSQTIVYSAMYSTMEISGLAYARPIKDVRITDFKVSEESFDAISYYETFSANTISSRFSLHNNPGEMVFEIEVTNYGSADVGILEIIGYKPNNLAIYIYEYELKNKICDEDGKCNLGAVKRFKIVFEGPVGEYEINLKFDFRTYHKVTYTNIVNNGQPTEVLDGDNLNIHFSEGLTDVSILSGGTEISYYESIFDGQTITIENVSGDIEIKKSKELVAKLVSGEIDEVGSEVCINDECFYIISNDGTKVAMLAKYNLNIGNECEGSGLSLQCTERLEGVTGIQDENMNQYGDHSIGVTPFSDINSNYSGSIVEVYVNNYKNYLVTQGITPTNIRLLTKEEAEIFGCNENDMICKNAPKWLYSRTFWTSNTIDNNVWQIWDKAQYFYTTYDDRRGSGVRPVIELSINDIKLPSKPVMVSGNYNEVGSEVAIDDEHFYVISSNATTVTMLAKYNLYVGGEYSSNWTPYGNEATGKQNSAMIGWSLSGPPYKGVTAFSNNGSAYSGSLIESYLDNYSIYLNASGVNTVEVRLITLDELKILGCSEEKYNCSEAPNWLYSTSYWTGTELSTIGARWYVDQNSSINWGENNYDNNRHFGVRPVITIKKTYFKNKINFTIEGTSYQAYDGMTWKEWIDSDFNTSGIYYTNTNYIYTSNGKSVIGNNNCALSTDVINSSNTYIILNSGYSCE